MKKEEIEYLEKITIEELKRVYPSLDEDYLLLVMISIEDDILTKKEYFSSVDEAMTEAIKKATEMLIFERDGTISYIEKLKSKNIKYG